MRALVYVTSVPKISIPIAGISLGILIFGTDVILLRGVGTGVGVGGPLRFWSE